MDNYVLVERLGQGSFAVVWKARRKSDHRVVAVKQLKSAPATWEECKRLPEIRAAATVRGPNIIALLEAVRHGSELFLVFEYADSDLYRCLGPCERRRFEESQVRWVMRQLISALASVHAAGLVHCDVKPENLLLFARLGPCGEPVLKLCDLGQAAPAGEVPSYVGTRWYRAPELLLGVSRAGVEIDLWAAGCFMAELILLRPPFPGTDTRDMLFRICSALGAPQEGWHLNERLMQASGLRFAPSAAEGPLWFELSSTGASHSAVEIVRGLLRYDQAQRLPASRALTNAFFQNGLPEVPVVPPEKDLGRLRTAEGMSRTRDEAKAFNKRYAAASGTTGPFTGFGGTGLGGLGLSGLSVSEVTPTNGLTSSASSPGLNTLPAGYSSAVSSSGMGKSSSAATLTQSQKNVEEAATCENSLSSSRRQPCERSSLPLATLPALSAARRIQNRTRRDLVQPTFSGSGLAMPGIQENLTAGRENTSEPMLNTSVPLVPAVTADGTTGFATEQGSRVIRVRDGSIGSASSDPPSPTQLPVQGRRARGVRESGGSDCGEGDDEEIAALFWNKVETGRVREQDNGETRRP